MNNQPDLTIVLPAWLEAQNLENLIPALLAAIPNTTRTEILVVDSPTPLDNTEEICRMLGVRHVRRDGSSFGDAFRTGVKEARGRLLLFMDADGSHPADLIPLMLSESSKGADLVIASRYVQGGRTENPWHLIAMSYVVNLCFRLVLHLPCRDCSNSYRLYRAADLKTISPRCQNFDILQEVLILLLAKNPLLQIREIPVTFSRRDKGATKRNLVAFAFSYIFTLVKLLRIRTSLSSRKGDS